MTVFDQETFTGERAQYFSKDASYKSCTFCDGESHLKHASNIILEDSNFKWKYPLWNCENVQLKNCTLFDMAKSGIWYTNNISMENTVIQAPKEFRRCNGVELNNVSFSNAAETLWNCHNVKFNKVTATGDYFGLDSSDFDLNEFTLFGNYFFDGGKNIKVRNSRLISKDAFWNCENVEVYDSYISGEYLAWYSKNVRFVNCIIESNQGLCYIDNLTMENCKLINTDLAFEYSTNIKAEINSKIDSVKNPGSGEIKAQEIKTLIMNPLRCEASKIKINCEKIGQCLTEDENPNENPL